MKYIPFGRFLWTGMLFVGASVAGHAHTRSETHSAWQIVGPTVHLQFSIPDPEAKRLAAAGKDNPNNEELGRYLSSHVGATAAGKDCALRKGPRSISSTPGYRRFEFEFQCLQQDAIRVHSSAFFDVVATHTNFARIEDSSGHFAEQLITQDHQTIDASAGSQDPLQSASFFQYIELGIMHIFTGVDHQSFLLGLVLLSRRLRDLVFVVTGFTLGHSLTLALAVTGIIRPHPEYIDALVGLTIALIGAENIAANTGRALPAALGMGGLLFALTLGRMLGWGGLPPLILLGAGLFAANYLMLSGRLRDAARLRLLVTLVFGLIHGFGFASNLLEMRLPTQRLAELLVGFNLGVELAQLTLVASVMGAAAMLVRLRFTLPRPIVTDVMASFLIGLGLYWFVLRSYA